MGKISFGARIATGIQVRKLQHSKVKKSFFLINDGDLRQRDCVSRQSHAIEVEFYKSARTKPRRMSRG